MPQPLTTAHLDGIRAEMRDNTKDLLNYMGQRFSKLDEQLVPINTKLDAIMTGDVLVTRGQLLRVFAKLKAQGVTIDEREIFRT